MADNLEFVKNEAALKPIPTNVWQAHDGRGTVQAMRVAEQLTANELTAREAVGRSLLSVERTLQRYAVAPGLP